MALMLKTFQAYSNRAITFRTNGSLGPIQLYLRGLQIQATA